MRITRLAGVCAVLVLGTSWAWSQALPEQQKLLAKRAAEADAFRKLAEIVYGLQINGQTYVRDFVTESDDIRTAVDEFVKGVRLGPPTYLEDGTCEVPAEVTVAKVVETLRSAHERYYKGDDIKISDYESITRRIEKDVVRVVGVGAVRSDLPPALPEGAEALIEAAPQAAAAPRAPAIWSGLDPRARLTAVRAARVDAIRRLAERLKGLRLTSNTRVVDFAVDTDEIRTELNTRLGTSGEEVATYLHSDALIAEVTLRIPTEQVISTIKSLHSRHYKGDDVKGHDIESVVRSVVRKDFQETGMGVPKAEYLRQFQEKAGEAVPAWAIDALTASGEGTDPEIDTPHGKLRAARAAELDAKRKLAEQIRGLSIRADTTVKDLVAKNDSVAAYVDAVLNNALVDKTDFAGGSARVTVTVHGMELWDAVNDGLRETP